MPRRVPVDVVLSMIKQGYTDADIIQYLREEHYSPRQINDAINQAKIKFELAKTAGMEAGESEGEYYEAESEPGQEMQPSIMSRGEEAEESEEHYYPESAETPTPETPTPEAPAPEAPAEAYPSAETEATSTEATEEIAEEIIKEKWEEFLRKVGNISEFKTYVESRLKSNEDRVRRLEKNIDRVQESTLGKVQ